MRARDGASVAVSLAFRRDVELRAGNPLVLSAYGAYGMSADFVSFLFFCSLGFLIYSCDYSKRYNRWGFIIDGVS